MEKNEYLDLFHQMILRLAMLRPASWVLARTLPRLDPPVMRLSKNRHSLTSLLSGLPLVTLTTRGAQSGLARRVPLIPQVDGEKLIFIASNFGQRHNPGWHYNLLAHPQAQVTRDGKTRAYIARQAQGEERERYWGMAVRSYPGYAAYARRASHRSVGVWVLEPESFTTEFTESTEIKD